MVKLLTELQYSTVSSQGSEELRKQLEILISDLSLPTLSTLIKLFYISHKSSESLQLTKNAYTSVYICFMLQAYSSSPSPKVLSNCKLILKKLLDLQIDPKPSTNYKSIFKLTQHVLTFTTQLLERPKTPEQQHLYHLLKLFQTLDYEIVISVLLKILSGIQKQSIYSFFTNENFPLLPKVSRKKPTLVLDLDETLGHYNGSSFLIRPGCCEFLHKVNEKFELVLFTAGQENYANAALAAIDKENLINFRLYRQHLLLKDGKICKDLRVLGRELNRVVIVDNEPSNFRNQPDCGIAIRTWKGEAEDKELDKLGKFLCEMDCEGDLNLSSWSNEIFN